MIIHCDNPTCRAWASYDSSVDAPSIDVVGFIEDNGWSVVEPHPLQVLCNRCTKEAT